MEEIDKKLEIPAEERSTSLSKEEAEFIFNFIKKENLKKTMEVGLAFGYSTAYIMSATESEHVAIDPFQNKQWRNLGKKNIRALGFGDKLSIMEDYSHNALPELLKANQRFEFIFIDGGHKYDEIFVDWYYSDLILEKGGFILFHDSWMQSTQMTAQFIRKNRKDYAEVNAPVKNFVLFQKIGNDNRDWHHFKNFCTLKGFFTHTRYKLFNR